MVALHNVRFPVDISYGSRGGPGFKTEIITLDSGAEVALSKWDTARHRYRIVLGQRSPAQWAALKKFYMGRMGAAYGFRYLDWDDYATTPTGVLHHGEAITATDVEIGIGDGVTTEFTLVKKYVSGNITRTRTIAQPIHDEAIDSDILNAATYDVLAAIDGTPTTAFTISGYPATITFSTAPASGAVITAGFLFDVPVRFAEDTDDLLELEASGFETGETGVELIEIVDPRPVYEDRAYDGAKDWGAITADVNLSPFTGALNRFTQTVGSLNVILPDPATIPLGYEFLVANDGSSTLTIRDTSAGGTVIDQPVASERTHCYLALDGATRIWVTR